MGRFTALFGRPEFLAKFHTWAAWGWFLFGLYGAVTYALAEDKGSALAASVPVLFFISVYANTVGHWSSQQASKVEVKQDEQIMEGDG